MNDLLNKTCQELDCDDCPLNEDGNLCLFARNEGMCVPLNKVLDNYIKIHKESLNRAEDLIYPKVQMFYGPQDYYDADRRTKEEKPDARIH